MSIGTRADRRVPRPWSWWAEAEDTDSMGGPSANGRLRPGVPPGVVVEPARGAGSSPRSSSPELGLSACAVEPGFTDRSCVVAP
jgi:hypothetical protein